VLLDLGGIAAKWVIAADGAGKTLGGSADSKARYRQAEAAYTGFRLAHAAAKVK
jgi:hypothetical protein